MIQDYARNFTVTVLAANAAALSLGTQAQTMLLGIPFGEKLALTQCPPNTDKAKSPCWIDRPFFYKPTGTKSGYVHLPRPNERPEWAAHTMFQIVQDKDGRVQELKVETFESQNKHQISESISRRFGKPTQDELQRRDASWAYWQSAEGYVAMRCTDKCWIEFRTPAAQADRQAELSKRERENAARPKAP